MHKIPLTELELSGLKAHKLPIGKPSQLSDSFRLGMAWVLKQSSQIRLHECECRCDNCGVNK